MVGAVSVTSCSATDLSCLCVNDAYIHKAITCINSSCSPSDAQKAYSYAAFACKQQGVTVPSVDSVLGTSSSSAAPSPAAADTHTATPASSTTPSPNASSPSSSTLATFKSGAAPKLQEGVFAGVVGLVAIVGAGLL